MAPREIVKQGDISVSGVLDENDVETVDGGLKTPAKGIAKRRHLKLVWRNIILFAYLHFAAVYGLWLMLTSAKWATGLLGKFSYAIKSEYLINFMNFNQLWLSTQCLD